MTKMKGLYNASKFADSTKIVLGISQSLEWNFDHLSEGTKIALRV